MLIEIILALIFGVAIGTLTGLIPGIHINLVATILLSISAFLLTITSPIVLIVFIVSMSITHTFVDYIPSIFLGAPNEDTILSILPGHKMLLLGEGYKGLIITLYGSLASIPIILIFIPVFIFLLPKIYPYVLRIMPVILILISFFLIISEKNKKLKAMFIFIAAGFLGIASLNLNISQPLLPLLTGLFGASGLLLSLNQKAKIPVQEIEPLREIKFQKKSLVKSILASTIASPFTAFLPGLGASQAALIGSQVIDNLDEKEFLFTLGAIDTMVMALSFIALYSIQKTRTGAAVAVNNLMEKLSFSNLILIILVIVISGIIAFFITILIAKFISKRIHKIKYYAITIVVLIILFLFTIIFSGIIGIFIFIVSASLGIVCIQLEVKRSHLMGCLLIPTILFYI